MRHFLSFLAMVFIGLFVVLYLRQNSDPQSDRRPVLKVYANSSFIKQWGPGPWLKEKFEESCGCRVDYADAADSVLLLQKLKADVAGADVVLGFDQYSLEMAQKNSEWKNISTDKIEFYANIKAILGRSNLVPYDWGVMALMARPSEVKNIPRKFEDLLNPEFKEQIALQDPRTSSAGLQFLFWLIQSMGEDRAFKFLERLNPQVKTWGPNWSMSYGLFQKGQAKLAMSWVTSMVYHKIEEKNVNVTALEFSEGHPMQIEYMGIPTSCRNCDLASKFAGLVLSPEGQKIIMEKNYMFPVVQKIREESAFADVPNFKLMDSTAIPSQLDRERILRKWSQLRRGE